MSFEVEGSVAAPSRAAPGRTFRLLDLPWQLSGGRARAAQRATTGRAPPRVARPAVLGPLHGPAPAAARRRGRVGVRRVLRAARAADPARGADLARRRLRRPRQVDGRLGDAAAPRRRPRLLRRAAVCARHRARRRRRHRVLQRQSTGGGDDRGVGRRLDAPPAGRRAGGSWCRKSPLGPNQHHRLASASERPCTHLRLHIFPDGGVARLRAYGEVVPDWSRVDADAAPRPRRVRERRPGGVRPTISTSARCTTCSCPAAARTWATAGRRGGAAVPATTSCVLRLGHPGTIERVELDTAHFKGNYPDRAVLRATLHRRRRSADRGTRLARRERGVARAAGAAEARGRSRARLDEASSRSSAR